MELCHEGVLGASQRRSEGGDLGEVGGPGEAGDVGVALGVESDPVGLVVAATAHVRRVDERAPAAQVELDHEGVAAAPVGQGGIQRGEVRRVGISRHVDALVCANRNGHAGIGAAAAEVSRGEEGAVPGRRRVQLGDERVRGALQGSSVGVPGGEIGRGRVARDVHHAGRIDGDAQPHVDPGAGEIGGVVKGVARGGQLRGERVGTRHVPLVGVLGGVVGGFRESRDVGIARGIHRDGVSLVALAPPEQRRIDEGRRPRQGRIELGHERVGAPGRTLERGAARKVGRLRVPGHVHHTGADGYPERGVRRAASQVRRIEQARAGGIELGHEGIRTALVRLIGVEGGKIRRLRQSGNVRVAGRVDGDGGGCVVAVATQIRGVHEARSAGVQLGHEGLARARRRHRAGGMGKVRRLREARYVGVTGGVDGDGHSGVDAAAAKVGRVVEDGIDHEGPARVVRGHLDADLGPGPGGRRGGRAQDVARRHLAPGRTELLVGQGLAQAQIPAGGAEDEVALGIDVKGRAPFGLTDPGEAKPDRSGVGAGGEDEVVLELAGVAVEHQVDTGIDAAGSHPGVGGHPGAPPRAVGANQVVDARRLLLTAHRRGRLGPEQLQADDRTGRIVQAWIAAALAPHRIAEPGSRRPPSEGGGLGDERDFRGTQKQRVALALGDEGDAGVRLAVVGHEAQREVAIPCPRPRFGGLSGRQEREDDQKGQRDEATHRRVLSSARSAS